MNARIQYNDNTIETKDLVKAITIVGTLLWVEWKSEGAEGDGEDDYAAAFIQADDMVAQSMANGLNLEADSVSVQVIQ